MRKLLAVVGILLLVAVASGAFFFLQQDEQETAAATSDAAAGDEEAVVARPELEGTQGPAQPIFFLHSVHAGDNQIPCMYCHYTADRSSSAGIPSVKLCVGCHIAGSAAMEPDQVQALTYPVPGQGEERPDWWYAEANKLLDYWKTQTPIPWVKVHDLPAHAKFPHYMHVRAGLECQTCHGPVEEMEQVYQYSSLQMGWCIGCHVGDAELPAEQEALVRERSTYRNEIATLAAAGEDVAGAVGRWPHMRASVDCTVCHY